MWKKKKLPPKDYHDLVKEIHPCYLHDFDFIYI